VILENPWGPSTATAADELGGHVCAQELVGLAGDFLGGLGTRRASLWAVIIGTQLVGLVGAALVTLATGHAWPGLAAVWPVLLGGLASVKLQQLSGSQVSRLYATLAESGGRDGKRGLSPLTIHHVHSCLHKACQDAVRWGLISRNPLDAADPPRTKGDGTKEMRTWSAEQLGAFLSSVRNDRLHPLWHLIAMTGMRRGEAIGLRWSDVDLENARLAVRRALIPTNREVVVSEPKTAKGRRVIALDPATVEVLKSQALRQLEEQREWGEAWTDTGLVFTKENGEALDPETITRWFRIAVKKALLPTIRLHDLRHTHATLALQAGIHPKVVSERLGHATVSITLDTYSHAIPAMQEEAAALIAGLVLLDR
jgi:integrase